MDNDSGGMVIISPCSTCKNQLAESDGKGHPACPRRYWQAQKKAAQAAGTDTTPYDILAYSGKDPDDGTLVNPAYWDSGNSIVVWVAPLLRNQAVLTDTQVLNPDITTGLGGNWDKPGCFNTEYMNCSAQPYSPHASEADYFQSGILREGETACVTNIPLNQNYVGATVNGFPTTTKITFAGTVQRVSFPYKVPRVPVNDHDCPEGT